AKSAAAKARCFVSAALPRSVPQSSVLARTYSTPLLPAAARPPCSPIRGPYQDSSFCRTGMSDPHNQTRAGRDRARRFGAAKVRPWVERTFRADNNQRVPHPCRAFCDRVGMSTFQPPMTRVPHFSLVLGEVGDLP